MLVQAAAVAAPPAAAVRFYSLLLYLRGDLPLESTSSCSSLQERITGLPAEFLSTQTGQMILPMLTQMEAQMKQMNGKALFSDHQNQQERVGTASVADPPPATNSVYKGTGSSSVATDEAVSSQGQHVPYYNPIPSVML